APRRCACSQLQGGNWLQNRKSCIELPPSAYTLRLRRRWYQPTRGRCIRHGRTVRPDELARPKLPLNRGGISSYGRSIATLARTPGAAVQASPRGRPTLLRAASLLQAPRRHKGCEQSASYACESACRSAAELPSITSCRTSVGSARVSPRGIVRRGSTKCTSSSSGASGRSLSTAE